MCIRYRVQYLLDQGVDPQIPGIDAPQNGFADIVERLSRTLVEVKPSELFVEQLRQQLLYSQRPDPQTMWQRIHQLPLRMRLAAGIGGATLTAGVLLIASRPYLMDVLTSWRDR